MMQPNDLSMMRKMLDGILDSAANAVLDIVFEVVMEAFFYLIEFVLNLL